MPSANEGGEEEEEEEEGWWCSRSCERVSPNSHERPNQAPYLTMTVCVCVVDFLTAKHLCDEDKVVHREPAGVARGIGHFLRNLHELLRERGGFFITDGLARVHGFGLLHEMQGAVVREEWRCGWWWWGRGLGAECLR